MSLENNLLHTRHVSSKSSFKVIAALLKNFKVIGGKSVLIHQHLLYPNIYNDSLSHY